MARHRDPFRRLTISRFQIIIVVDVAGLRLACVAGGRAALIFFIFFPLVASKLIPALNLGAGPRAPRRMVLWSLDWNSQAWGRAILSLIHRATCALATLCHAADASVHITRLLILMRLRESMNHQQKRKKASTPHKLIVQLFRLITIARTNKTVWSLP